MRMAQICLFLGALVGMTTTAGAQLITVADYDFADDQAPVGFAEFGDPTYVDGQLVLDGAGDYIQAVAPTVATDNVVLETIVSAETFGVFNFTASITNADGSNSGYGVVAQGGSWRAITSGVGFPGLFPHGNPPTASVALAYVREAGDSSLYVNGLEFDSGGGDGNITLTDSGVITIGGHNFDVPNGVFDGSIDRVRVSTFAGAFDPTELLGPNDGTIGESSTIIADLAADYREAPADGQTSSDLGISGTNSGLWNYYSDTDSDPTNGGLALLTFGSTGLEGGDGYAGTGTVFNDCCGPFPAISDDGLFDGVATLPPGVLAGHPGSSSSTPPEFLAIEYTATDSLEDLVLSYFVENPGSGGDGIGFAILDGSGSELATGTLDGSSTGLLTLPLGELNPGDQLWFVLDNGPGDNAATDQTFIQLRLSGSVAGQVIPEPATGGLWSLGFLGLATWRSRRQA